MGRDLWIVAPFFNPDYAGLRLQALLAFRHSAESTGIPVVIIEAAFGDEPFVVDGANVVRIRCKDVLWQKERLVNAALPLLPRECTKVAWLDADILFEDIAWERKTSALLDRFMIVQPFSEVVRLWPGASQPVAECQRFDSFAARLHDPNRLIAGVSTHGHPGFAWAARRDFLERYGLYDRAICGNGDHVMAHAVSGDWSSPCLDLLFERDTPYFRHVNAWARDFHAGAQGRLAVAEGRILHLWHGDRTTNHCEDTARGLAALSFDPERHVRVGADGALEWQDGTSSEIVSWASSSLAVSHRCLQSRFL